MAGAYRDVVEQQLDHSQRSTDSTTANLFESAYQTNYYGFSNPMDFSVNADLPTITIGDSLDDMSANRGHESTFAAMSPVKSMKMMAARDSMEFNENKDGSYSYTAERGDTYWKVARTVLMDMNGVSIASDIKHADIQKMVKTLLAYNDKPTSGAGANSLLVGEEIRIPKDLADVVEEHRDRGAERKGREFRGERETKDKSDENKPQGEWKFRADEKLEKGEELTADEKRAWLSSFDGIKATDPRLEPVDGAYNPLQPPGLEPGTLGDYDADFWNYDGEEKTITSDTTDDETGLRTKTYRGQIDSGIWANGQAYNDTPYSASETINKNGVVTERTITYRDSRVELNFEGPAGETVDDYISMVNTSLEPKSGNYRTHIQTTDGANYYMMVDGQTGQVLRNTISMTEDILDD
ncbi:MAG: hypothetical protein C0507_23145 [Cyanobacteria bacterium PR.3.49]|nr:hypothetical protein [Cyanobacteria bacterium PR.3.49]